MSSAKWRPFCLDLNVLNFHLPDPSCVDGYQKFEFSHVVGAYERVDSVDDIHECMNLCKTPSEKCGGLDFK